MADESSSALTLRLPSGLLDRARALLPDARRLPELSTATRLSRADVLRVALARGLVELEAELGAGPQLPLE